MIVFNSSTLILLAKTELLELFLDAVDEKVVVPKEVEKECRGGKDFVDALLIQKAIKEKEITVRSLKDRRLYTRIREDFPLGPGEAEAVALAFSAKAGLFATDDKKAIQASKLLKIPFTTAVDILVRMREKAILGKEDALLKLKALERNGRYRKEIIAGARLKLEVG